MCTTHIILASHDRRKLVDLPIEKWWIFPVRKLLVM